MGQRLKYRKVGFFPKFCHLQCNGIFKRNSVIETRSLPLQVYLMLNAFMFFLLVNFFIENIMWLVSDMEL